MAEQVVVEAIDAALGRPASRVRQLASGKSSEAWRCDVDGTAWVVRVPIPDSGRLLSYRSEATIGRLLAAQEQPVATWQTVEIDGVPCSLAPFIAGAPIGYDTRWTEGFARDLAKLLQALHELPATGFGPLQDNDSGLAGSSSDPRLGIVDRWFHASVWPFDETLLADHVVARRAPDRLVQVAPFEAAIKDAADMAAAVVHSDLHTEHLLVTPSGDLAAVLDFGDAFIGAPAWDFALLRWYYGAANAGLVAAHYRGGDELLERGSTLAIAVGLYKLAKQPDNHVVLTRLVDLLDATISAGS